MLVNRANENPVLKPSSIHPWDAEAAFNGCPVMRNGKIYLVYRALSLPHYHTFAGDRLKVSSIGVADSKDGVVFHNRKRLVYPDQEWDRFSCEDPRVTEFEGKYYIFYTAISTYPFSAQGIRVGVAVSSDLESIEEKHLVTPFNAKAMALFPKRIDGKIWAVLTVNTDLPESKICLASFDKVEDMWDESYWQKWYQNRDDYSLVLARKSEDRIEVGSTPVETKDGWLMFYSYIDNYFSSDPLFTIESVLLDLNNPMLIIARSKSALLTSQEYYERIGLVPNIVFPSGAIIVKELIYLYYGAADTVCCLATINTANLLEKLESKKVPVKFSRFEENPIISPIAEHSWESKATLNPGAIFIGDKVHFIYRAMSEDNTSVFGYANSKDGIHIDYRSPDPVYVPRDLSEQKEIPWGNSGCEDPRLTVFEDKVYMLYTSFNGKNPPRISISSITIDDFVTQKWNWIKSVLISSPNIDDKDACLFPEKIHNKYFIIHRYGDDIDTDFVPDLDFDKNSWVDEYRWISPRKGMWDSKKIGVAAPPIKTSEGWILFYHGVSDSDNHYRVGAVLLDITDPLKILARSEEPLLEPTEKYEVNGQVSNVVFPCGAVLIGDDIYIYYGGGDSVIGGAKISASKLTDYLGKCLC